MTVNQLPAETTFPTIRTMLRLYIRWRHPATGAEHFYVCTQPLHPKTGEPWQANTGVGPRTELGAGTYLDLAAAVAAYDAKAIELAKREAKALSKIAGAAAKGGAL